MYAQESRDEEKQRELKKLIRMLKRIKGRHTELVSVYIPSGYSLIEMINQLREERGTAENIKSKTVRKHVVSALEKIIAHLQSYRRTPENGLAVFCGNVAEKEGETDIRLFYVIPPEPIRTKLYWCDQVFRLEVLEEMVKEKEVYGIVCLDSKEADVALLRGKRIEHALHLDSIVPGKTHKGGQSAARFSRVREALREDWFKKVGEAANKILSQEDVQGVIISGPGPAKNDFLEGDYLYAKFKNKVVAVVDTGYTGEYGIEETIERAKDKLKELSITKEKNLLHEFFALLSKGEAVYGAERVKKALEAGAAKIVMVSEDLEDEFGFLEEECEKTGAEFKIISVDTREGSQFRELSGVGAILRFKIEV